MSKNFILTDRTGPVCGGCPPESSSNSTLEHIVHRHSDFVSSTVVAPTTYESRAEGLSVCCTPNFQRLVHPFFEGLSSSRVLQTLQKDDSVTEVSLSDSITLDSFSYHDCPNLRNCDSQCQFVQGAKSFSLKEDRNTRFYNEILSNNIGSYTSNISESKLVFAGRSKATCPGLVGGSDNSVSQRKLDFQDQLNIDFSNIPVNQRNNEFQNNKVNQRTAEFQGKNLIRSDAQTNDFSLTTQKNEFVSNNQINQFNSIDQSNNFGLVGGASDFGPNNRARHPNSFNRRGDNHGYSGRGGHRSYNNQNSYNPVENHKRRVYNNNVRGNHVSNYNSHNYGNNNENNYVSEKISYRDNNFNPSIQNNNNFNNRDGSYNRYFVNPKKNFLYNSGSIQRNEFNQNRTPQSNSSGIVLNPNMPSGDFYDPSSSNQPGFSSNNFNNGTSNVQQNMGYMNSMYPNAPIAQRRPYQQNNYSQLNKNYFMPYTPNYLNYSHRFSKPSFDNLESQSQRSNYINNQTVKDLPYSDRKTSNTTDNRKKNVEIDHDMAKDFFSVITSISDKNDSKTNESGSQNQGLSDNVPQYYDDKKNDNILPQKVNLDSRHNKSEKIISSDICGKDSFSSTNNVFLNSTLKKEISEVDVVSKSFKYPDDEKLFLDKTFKNSSKLNNMKNGLTNLSDDPDFISDFSNLIKNIAMESSIETKPVIPTTLPGEDIKASNDPTESLVNDKTISVPKISTENNKMSHDITKNIKDSQVYSFLTILEKCGQSNVKGQKDLLVGTEDSLKSSINLNFKMGDSNLSSKPYFPKNLVKLSVTKDFSDKSILKQDNMSFKDDISHELLITEKMRCVVGHLLSGHHVYSLEDILFLRESSNVDTTDALNKLELRGCNIIKASLRPQTRSFGPNTNLFKKPETVHGKTEQFLILSLNRISLNNFNKILTEISDFKFTCVEEFQVLIKLFFEKCINEHIWTYMYVQLFIRFFERINLRLQHDKSGKLSELSSSIQSLKNDIIEMCFSSLVRDYQKEKEYNDVKNTPPTGKSEVELDEIFRTAYELEVAYIKHYQGILLTLSLFYAYGFINYSYIKRAFDSFGELKDPIDIELTCFLVGEIGDLVFKLEKTNNLTEIISRIIDSQNHVNIPTKLKFQIIDLKDDFKKRWNNKKPRIIVPEKDMSTTEMDLMFNKMNKKTTYSESYSTTGNRKVRHSQPDHVTNGYKRPDTSNSNHILQKKMSESGFSNRQLDRNALGFVNNKSNKFDLTSNDIDQNLDDMEDKSSSMSMLNSKTKNRTAASLKKFKTDSQQKNEQISGFKFSLNKVDSKKPTIKTDFKTNDLILSKTVESILETNPPLSISSFAKSSAVNPPSTLLSEVAQSFDFHVDFDSITDLMKHGQMLLNDYLYNHDQESFLVKLQNHDLVDKIHHLVICVITMLGDQKISDHYSLGVLLAQVNQINRSTMDAFIKCIKVRMPFLYDISFDLPLVWEFLTLMLFPLIDKSLITFDLIHELFMANEDFGVMTSDVVGTMFTTISTKFSVLEATKIILYSKDPIKWIEILKTPKYICNQSIKSVIDYINTYNLSLELINNNEFIMYQWIEYFLNTSHDNESIIKLFNKLPYESHQDGIYELSVQIFMRSMVDSDYFKTLDKIFAIRNAPFLKTYFGESTPNDILDNVITIYKKFHMRHNMVFKNIGSVLFKQNIVPIEHFTKIGQDSKLESLHATVFQITRTK